MTHATAYSPPQETELANQVIECSNAEQAESEFYSRIRYQKERKGYSESIPTAPPSLPMLAQEYKGNPEFPGYAFQPKLDGIRCILSKDGLLSRKNRLITSCPHIELYLNRIPDGIKLDGELYIPNTPFNTIESYVMRTTPDRVSMEIEFHIFDIMDTEAPFEARIEEANRIVGLLEDAYIYFRTTPDHPYQKLKYFAQKCPFKLVQTIIEPDPTTINDTIIDHHFKYFLSQKYEGMMVRNLHAAYEINKRSKSLLKMKHFIDSEFEIIDVVAGSDQQGIFVCKTTNGEQFRCSFRGTKGKRQNILKYKDNYIGKFLKVEYEGLFPTGVPRCPVGVHYFAKEESDRD
jgi:ATP-dependent DNA ligase